MNIIQPLVFYSFSALWVISALLVVSGRQGVHSVLALIVSFFASAVLWMLLEAEFLSLVLIFVYVGAVMTLFLFVVMMLNLRVDSDKPFLFRYLPWSVLFFAVFFGVLLYWLVSSSPVFEHSLLWSSADSNNARMLGSVLYTRYMYPFELASLLLLASIVSAIVLAFRGRRALKRQSISDQIQVSPKDRVSLVDLSSK